MLARMVIGLVLNLIVVSFGLFVKVVIKTGLVVPILTYFVAGYFGLKGQAMLWTLVGSVLLTVIYKVGKFFRH